MKSVKLIVAYPQPKDASAFEKIYQQEHVPMPIANLQGMAKIAATKILQPPKAQLSFTESRRFIFHPWRCSSSARSLREAKQP
jgi:hypothetical protein